MIGIGLLAAGILAVEAAVKQHIENETSNELEAKRINEKIEEVKKNYEQCKKTLSEVDEFRLEIEKKLQKLDNQRLRFCTDELVKFLNVFDKVNNIDFSKFDEVATSEKFEEKISMYKLLMNNAMICQKAIKTDKNYYIKNTKMTIFENNNLLLEKIPFGRRKKETLFMQSYFNSVARWYQEGIDNWKNSSFSNLKANVEIDGVSLQNVYESYEKTFNSQVAYNGLEDLVEKWVKPCESVTQSISKLKDDYLDYDWNLLDELSDFYVREGSFWNIEGKDSIYASYYNSIHEWLISKWNNSYISVFGIIKIHKGIEYSELTDTEQRSLFQYWKYTDVIVNSIVTPVIDSNGMIYDIGSYLEDRTITEMRRCQQREIKKYIKEKCQIDESDMTTLIMAIVLKTIIHLVDELRIEGKIKHDEGEKLANNKIDKSKLISNDFKKEIKDVKVPYDVTEGTKQFNITGDRGGLGGKNHREWTLGHDWIYGWFWGVVNIITSTCTVWKETEISWKDKLVNKMSIAFSKFGIFRKIGKVVKLKKIIGVRTFEIGYVDVGGGNRKRFIREVSTVNTIKQAGIEIRKDKNVLVKAFLIQYYHIMSDYKTSKGIHTKRLIGNTLMRRYINTNLETLLNDLVKRAEGNLVDTCILIVRHCMYNEERDGDRAYYDIRTEKIILYSDTSGVMVNLVSSLIKKNLSNIDCFEIMKVIREFFEDYKKQGVLLEEFMNKLKESIEGSDKVEKVISIEANN